LTEAQQESAHPGSRVQASGLGRRFGDLEALRDVTLEIAPGESFGLLGANGAGKTTLIRMVTGFLLPTSGSIHVDGISVVKDPRSVQSRTGFVAETTRLYPELKVRSFLRMAGGIRGLGGAELQASIDRAIDRFQLREVAGRIIGNLSKGYRQRVSLAQSFLHGPSLLIVDEPTSGLDPLQQAEVRSALTELRGHSTILLCTHDLEEARELTSRVAVLSRGRIIRLGPTDEILGGDAPLDLFRGIGVDAT
jgi:ABC-2 type transport system ATP-binding protein